MVALVSSMVAIQGVAAVEGVVGEWFGGGTIVGAAGLEGLGILAYGALVLATIFVASRWAAEAIDVEAGRDPSSRANDVNAPRSGA